MKYPLPLLVLSLCAVKAQAFTTRVPSEPVGGNEAENRASFAFTSFHAMDMQTLQPGGVCDTASVSGCNCPFCSQLRSLGR